jgi:hypothetical protein
MKFSELALKKLNIITGETHERKELKFVQNFILPGSYSIQWKSGIALKDVSEFAKRIHDLEGRVIGLEVASNAPYPLHVLSCSDFYSQYSSDWIDKAIQQFQEWKVELHLVPVVDFPSEVLDKYLTDEFLS